MESDLFMPLETSITKSQDKINVTVGKMSVHDEKLSSMFGSKEKLYQTSYRIVSNNVTSGATTTFTMVFFRRVATKRPKPITTKGTMTNCSKKGSISGITVLHFLFKLIGTSIAKP